MQWSWTGARGQSVKDVESIRSICKKSSWLGRYSKVIGRVPEPPVLSSITKSGHSAMATIEYLDGWSSYWPGMTDKAWLELNCQVPM